jgi:cytochrome c oxidase assembly protein subunit 16
MPKADLMMGTRFKFQSKKYLPSSASNTFAAQYRRHLQKRPFLLFGLPFIATMVAGSFFLTPAAAVRYERHDRKVRQMTKEEQLGIGKEARKFDMREEYYVYHPWRSNAKTFANRRRMQRLAAKDLNDWEQKRVKRLPGEHDGVL